MELWIVFHSDQTDCTNVPSHQHLNFVLLELFPTLDHG